MLNQAIVVGRLVEKPVLEENTTSTLVLAVSKSYKNREGIYETDYIPVNVSGHLANEAIEYCEKGDIIGVKGRLARANGSEMQFIAFKITFLSSESRNAEFLEEE